MYLDAYSNGFAFDYDTEVGKNFSAGVGNESINPDTGVKRLKIATDWAEGQGREAGADRSRHADRRPALGRDVQARHRPSRAPKACEIYTWMGGNHWPIRNYAINNVPGWHQNKTLEPAVTGPLKAVAGVARATIYDDGPGYAVNGTSVTITVYARGFLAADLTLTVSSSNGGTLSKSLHHLAGRRPIRPGQLHLHPAPTASPRSRYCGSAQVPPPRKVYSLADPVAYASTSLADAALAIIAKYGACKWEMADGHTDYMLGAPSADGQPIRAVSDSGYGSSAGQRDGDDQLDQQGRRQPGHDVAARHAHGQRQEGRRPHRLRHLRPVVQEVRAVPGIQANPKNRVPYNVDDAHFAIAAVSVPGQGNGIVFQASKAEAGQTSRTRHLQRPAPGSLDRRQRPDGAGDEPRRTWPPTRRP